MSLTLGCHLSVAQGYAALGKTAASIGATTAAFFTRNPRGGSQRALDEGDIVRFQAIGAENGFGTLVAHAPYTMNLCSSKADVREFGRQCLTEDIERLEHLPGSYLNFHPGSHTGQGAEVGCGLIAEALCAILDESQTTTILLETMAGKGTEVGATFEEIDRIITMMYGLEGADERVGVCLDTCHVWDAGYDIRDDLDGVLKEFDRIVGIDRLRALHLNDSKSERGSHKDRHEKLGKGSLGLECFERIVNHPALHELPMILETPNELPGYKREIATLRKLAGEKD